MQIEIHWSPLISTDNPLSPHVGLVGNWAATQCPAVGELIWIEEDDLQLRLRVTSVRWKFPLGKEPIARLNVESLDL